MTTITTHRVKRVETEKREELSCGGYTRTIVVTNENGEETRLVLFADGPESLEIKGDRL